MARRAVRGVGVGSPASENVRVEEVARAGGQPPPGAGVDPQDVRGRARCVRRVFEEDIRHTLRVRGFGGRGDPIGYSEAAGNVVASNFPIPTPPGAPDAAKALFPLIVVHTFQATYGLPEYRGQHTDAGVWRSVGWDGDTQPLGNSIYDERLFGPGKGPNAGFGDTRVYQPRGGYRERRPVSTLGAGDGVALSKKDVAPLVKALRAQARAAGRARQRARRAR